MALAGRLSIGSALLTLTLLPAATARGGDFAEVGAGLGSPWGGTKVALAGQHDLRRSVAATANVEWSQRPYIEPGVDHRLAYAGAGLRLRLFPSERYGLLFTTGLGLGRFSQPTRDSTWRDAETGRVFLMPEPPRDPDWLAVPWLGFGCELRVHGDISVAAEARLEVLAGRGESELPLRLAVRVPIRKRSGRP